MDIAMQIAVRSAILAWDSCRAEKRAIRKLCTTALAARDSANRSGIKLRPTDGFPPSLLVPGWMAELGWDDIGRLERFLAGNTPGQMADLGRQALSAMIRKLRQNGDVSSDVEWIIRLAGTKHAKINGVRRPRPKSNWEPITEEMAGQLGARLECMRPTGITERACRAVSSESGLPALLMRAAWLTGMRSIELFSCRLAAYGIDPRPGAAMGSTLNATVAGRLPQIGEVGLQEALEAASRLSMHAEPEAGRGPFFALFIHSLKVKCTSPRLRTPLRVQFLDGLTHHDLMVLHQVSHLRHLNLSKPQAELISRACNRAIKTSAHDLFPDRSDPVTLNTFRHAFIDLARLTMPAAEIAALTGHTSVRGVRWYGRRYARYRPDRKPTRWMPAPDPARVAEISRVWAETHAVPVPGQEPEPTQELIFDEP